MIENLRVVLALIGGAALLCYLEAIIMSKTSKDAYIQELQQALKQLDGVARRHIEGYEGCTEQRDAAHVLAKGAKRR